MLCKLIFENEKLKKEIAFFRKLNILQWAIDEVKTIDRVVEILKRDMAFKGVVKYRATFNPEKNCWGVIALENFGEVSSISFSNYTELPADITEDSSLYLMKKAVEKKQIIYIDPNDPLHPGRGQKFIVPVIANEKETMIYKVEIDEQAQELDRKFINDNHEALEIFLSKTFLSISNISHQNYTERIIAAINKLSRIYDPEGNFNYTVGKEVIYETSKVFDYAEIAGFNANLLAAKKNPHSRFNLCWGQKDYSTVREGEIRSGENVKAFFIAYMQAFKSGDFSKLRKAMPRFDEHEAKKHFTVIKDENGEPLMFVIEDLDAFDDPNNSQLEMDIKINHEHDLNKEVYKNIPREYFKQIGFIPLLHNEKELDYMMVRKLLNCRNQQKFISLYPRNNKQDIDLFVKALSNFRAKYTDNYYANLQRKEVQLLKKRARSMSSITIHEVRNPVVTMGGYSKRILNNLDLNQESLGKIEKSANIILQEAEKLEININIIRQMQDNLFALERKKSEILPLLLAVFEQNMANNKYQIPIELNNLSDLAGCNFLYESDQKALLLFVYNVLDNACKYAKEALIKNYLSNPKVKIELQITEDLDNIYNFGSKLTIRIINDGLPANQEKLNGKLAQLFNEEKDIWDLTPDKEMDNEENRKNNLLTSGLGLAGTAWVIADRGDEFTMTARPEGGTIAELSLFFTRR